MAAASVAKAAETLLDPLALITPNRSLRVLSREQVAFAITQGHVLTIHRGFVYRLNNWLSKHPGADLPVLHFVGRDATDEIEAYHPVYALKMMRHHIVGRMESWEDDSVVDGEGWKPLVPPLHLGWPGKGAAYTGVPALDETMELMKTYEADGYPCSGSPKGTTLPYLSMADLEPPTAPSDIDRKEQQRIAVSFRKFRNEVLQIEGLFEVNPWPLYRYTMLRCAALFATFLGFYMNATQKWHYGISALALGFFMHQIMFVAHDAGHTEITGDRTKDRVIGSVIAAWASGMSLGWWNDQHCTHHLIPNHPEHDPDIQLLPFFAFSTRFFDSLYSTFHACIMPFDKPTQFLIQYQHYFFYPVMLFARFSLFGKSYHYLLTKAPADKFRTFELAGVAFFWTWYTLLLKGLSTPGASTVDNWTLRVVYTLLVLAAVCPIHVQIVLSHSAQCCEDKGTYETFAHRQLRTTMDVSCPDYLAFVHGGLECQISHHLFPRLPRPNLRKMSKLVKAWSIEAGVEFKEKSFSDGNDQMVGMLGDIAGQCRALLATADDVAKGRILLD